MSADPKKQIIDAFFAAMGKEPMSPEESDKFMTDLNRKLRRAEVGVYLFVSAVYFVGGGLAGTLLGFKFVAAGLAVLVLRAALTLDVKTEVKGMDLHLTQKAVVEAVKNARTARSGTRSSDLLPRA